MTHPTPPRDAYDRVFDWMLGMAGIVALGVLVMGAIAGLPVVLGGD